jgi:hypothetical protein
MTHRSGCLVCGEDLVYLKEEENLTCASCGRSLRGDVRCEAGHFICDTCHAAPAADYIESACGSTLLTDPLRLADLLMDNPSIAMHGPEHHYLVPAVLLACFYNHRGDPARKREKLARARSRAGEVPGGFCGTHGGCGAALGAGIFISLITEATPLSREEWRLSNTMTAKALQTIADRGGPRCCKRDSFIAIIEAVDFLEKNFDVSLPADLSVVCRFSRMNRECRLRECDFFDAKGGDNG